MRVINQKLLSELTNKQLELQEKLVLKSRFSKIKVIAGCDSSILNQTYIFSLFVLFNYENLEVIEIKYDYSEIELPYVPGFLAFREIPTLLKAYNKLESKPDLIMVDGNGIIHKRKMGIASHLGVLLNKPTIGIAKKLLYGYFREPENSKGSFSNIYSYEKEVIGYALRSKDGVKPIFISPGHMVSLEDSLEITKSIIRYHKLPEPTRLADKYSKELKKEVLPI